MSFKEEEIKLRQIAIDLNIKFKGEWFTYSQVAKLYGNENKEQIVAGLSFIGLLVSDTQDGMWKHKIVETPQQRLEVLKSNIASLEDQKKGIEDNIEFLTSLNKELEAEIA